MKSLKFIKQTGVRLIFSAAILSITSQSFLAQIKIGAIEIGGIKRPTATRDKNPQGKNQKGNPVTKPETQEESSKTDDPPEWWLKVIASDIAKAKEEVDSYTQAGKMYLVSSPSAPWLLRAVSSKAREEFAVDKKMNDWRQANAGNKFDTGLDELAASAAKKLPGYIPNLNNFANRDAAIEQMMKAKLKNFATLKLFKIGLFHANWIIEKNDPGLPTSRYREAYIWAKDASDDHNYCHLYGFVVQQDYAGGGTFGATYAYLNTDTLFGCPAN